MTARASIYLAPPLLRVLDGTTERSGRLNDVAARYLAIIDDAITRLPFSRDEWCAICDANNGCTGAGVGDDFGWQEMWANVADADGLGDKWGIDQDALVAHMRRTSLVEKAAMAEVVDRFWAHSDLPTDEALRAAGVRELR